MSDKKEEKTLLFIFNTEINFTMKATLFFYSIIEMLSKSLKLIENVNLFILSLIFLH